MKRLFKKAYPYSGLPLLFAAFLLAALLMKVVFIGMYWTPLSKEGPGALAKALLSGLRFDISVISYVFIAGLLLLLPVPERPLRRTMKLLPVWFAAANMLILVLWFADIQYFEEAGKHFTYEAFAYIGASAAPIISGAFALHPVLSSMSLAASFGASWAVWRMGKRVFDGESEDFSGIGVRAAAFAVCLAVLALGARGGLQHGPLGIARSCISPSPYLNAVCLNPVFSAFKSLQASSRGRASFFTEDFNVASVRGLFGDKRPASDSAGYPLVRRSGGTENGNRKNVVVFILESWAGKDIGALGGKAGVTPVFDDLSRQGLLFTNFYATGVRTAEGIFSVLCSFPNQPVAPIMKRPEAARTNWRSIASILDDAGYRSIFIHGRSLNFDGMGEFLRSVGFQSVLDRNDFPASVSPTVDSWPGYNDEDVMKRADEEFAKNGGKPFLGVIYTMNTHPPFVTPDKFPRSFPDTTPTNKYLNSLGYSDYSIGKFFESARKRAYFKDTVFIFVADHARTRDDFTLSNQHYIPFLIYSPGFVKPGVNSSTAGQLDILPTVLGLLNLGTSHAAWGRNLLEAGAKEGFAVSIAGNDVRWRDGRYLLNDNLGGKVLLFDTLEDPECRKDVWKLKKEQGEKMKTSARAYMSLSQTLLTQNRVYGEKTRESR